MSDFLALAEELEAARHEHLSSYGQPPRVVRQTRNKLQRMLWDDKATIIEALRIAGRQYQQFQKQEG